MTREIVPPCFYLLIYRKIKERANGKRVVPHFEVLKIVGQTAPHVPKRFRYIIIHEMEEYSMIKKLNKHKIQITGGNIDAKLEKYNPFILD